MEVAELADHLRRTEGWLPGKRILLDFGTAGAVMLDGIAGAVGDEPGAADATVTIDWADWLAMIDGRLDPMRAYLGGRLRIAGELAAAMELAGNLARSRA